MDNGSAWPGTSLSRTTDGGSTWSTILRIGTGIWGMDLISKDVGFAVGVTSLRRTTDGGDHWQQVSEPADHPLVWVDFTTNELGYGLTTTGTLVRTTDGGSSWRSAGLTRTGTAACFASTEVGYVADRSGAVYATHDGGGSWAEIKPPPVSVEQFIGPWNDISCNGTSIWLGQQLLCAAACAATSPYLASIIRAIAA
ncbi:MAG: WD40/YVTN/BNR-like repeat-containing protein [Acidimicrobiales bacterium]